MQFWRWMQTRHFCWPQFLVVKERWFDKNCKEVTYHASPRHETLFHFPLELIIYEWLMYYSYCIILPSLLTFDDQQCNQYYVVYKIKFISESAQAGSFYSVSSIIFVVVLTPSQFLLLLLYPSHNIRYYSKYLKVYLESFSHFLISMHLYLSLYS